MVGMRGGKLGLAGLSNHRCVDLLLFYPTNARFCGVNAGRDPPPFGGHGLRPGPSTSSRQGHTPLSIMDAFERKLSFLSLTTTSLLVAHVLLFTSNFLFGGVPPMGGTQAHTAPRRDWQRA